MIFKIANINLYSNMFYNNFVFRRTNDDIFDKVDETDNYFCFRLLRETNETRKGKYIQNDLSTKEALIPDSDTIPFRFDFIFIEKFTGKIYFNSNISTLNNLLYKNFGITKENVDYNVDLNALDSISSITFKEVKNKKNNLFSSNQSDNFSYHRNVTKEIIKNDQSEEFITHEYKYTNGSFSRSSLKKYIEKYKYSDDIDFYIKGFDKNNNVISIRDNITKKINLNDYYKTYDGIKNAKFSEIISLLEES